jgi:hypothetical protein
MAGLGDLFDETGTSLVLAMSHAVWVSPVRQAVVSDRCGAVRVQRKINARQHRQKVEGVWHSRCSSLPSTQADPDPSKACLEHRY